MGAGQWPARSPSAPSVARQVSYRHPNRHCTRSLKAKEQSFQFAEYRRAFAVDAACFLWEAQENNFSRRKLTCSQGCACQPLARERARDPYGLWEKFFSCHRKSPSIFCTSRSGFNPGACNQEGKENPMSGTLNKVQLIGHLGKDPEIRSFQNGGKAATLSLATSESWKDKETGERKERTEWHRISITNDGLVGVVEKYLKKGAKVYVEGQLETRKWTDKEGEERYSTEVVLRPYAGELLMLDPRKTEAA
jgi:single-strand DNA-binding protein